MSPRTTGIELRVNSLHVRLFCTDLDGTLLGSPMPASRFTAAWDKLPAQRRPLLVYNTERSVADTLGLVSSRHLPDPDFVIGGIGTELHDSLYNHAADFSRQFDTGWNLARVEEIIAASAGVRRQPSQGSRTHRSSWTWEGAGSDEIMDLKRRLDSAGLPATVVYSCRHFLDVLPAGAGKGQALDWLCRRLGVSLTQVLVAGDAGNDSSMFSLPGLSGIVVENALPELLADIAGLRVFAARSPLADGVLEGLEHFGVISGRGAGKTAVSGEAPRQAQQH